MVLKPFLLIARTDLAPPIIRIYRCSGNVRALPPIILRGCDSFLSPEQQGLMKVGRKRRRRRRINTPLICGMSSTTHTGSVGLGNKERHNLIIAKRKMKSRRKVFIIITTITIIVIQLKKEDLQASAASCHH